MTDSFRRILDLVRKTGDTMVVTDPNGEDVFVVMDLNQYEMLLKSDFVPEEEEDEKDIWETMKPADKEGETWDLSKMDEGELADLEEQYRQFAHSRVQEAVAQSAQNEPKIEEKRAEDDEMGEEQFYLEPVE